MNRIIVTVLRKSVALTRNPLEALRKKSRSIVKGLLKRTPLSDASESLSGSPDSEELVGSWNAAYCDSPKNYAVIVFSKDRPMQLHALLSSYLRNAAEIADVTVLYLASSKKSTTGYEECLRSFVGEKRFAFRKQSGTSTFSKDVRRILRETTATRIAFLVDDIVFIRRFDFRDFDDVDLRKYVPSLRLGRNITYSYTTAQPQALPTSLATRGRFLVWNWLGNGIDWSYPLSVDGNIFLRSEIIPLLDTIEFGSPNIMEGEMQKLARHFIRRAGICYAKPRLVNIPCNKVQTDVDNRHGNVTADFLLEKWLGGYRMKYEDLADMDTDSVHVDYEFQLAPRERA